MHCAIVMTTGPYIHFPQLANLCTDQLRMAWSEITAVVSLAKMDQNPEHMLHCCGHLVVHRVCVVDTNVSVPAPPTSE